MIIHFPNVIAIPQNKRGLNQNEARHTAYPKKNKKKEKKEKKNIFR